MPMSATRRNLTLADLSRLADVSATAADPMALFVEVDRLVGVQPKAEIKRRLERVTA